MIASEDVRTCGVAAEIAARVAEEGIYFLDAPIRRVDTVSDLLPELIWNRPKRPYRAPIHASFFPAGIPLDWVAEMRSPSSIRAADCFNPDAVAMLQRKLERTGSLGETDDMALAGVLSTQLVHQHFVADSAAPRGLSNDDRVKVVRRTRESCGSA